MRGRLRRSPRVVVALLLLSTNAVTLTLSMWLLPFYSLGFYSRAGPQYGNPVYNRLSRVASSTPDRTSNLRTIHVITPTHARPTQKVDLTSLCHTLMHVERIHWIVIEDSTHRSELVSRLLKRCDVASTHLVTTSTNVIVNSFFRGSWRGLEQRNLALSWLRAQCGLSSTSLFTETVMDNDSCSNGVIYFADDDNKYDLRLFEQIRATKGVSMWPVAFAAKLRYEGPICVHGQKVTGWHTSFAKERDFPTDMAGFAVNLELILKYSGAKFRRSRSGWLETDFLHQLGITVEDLECRDGQIKEVLVWHTKTETPTFQGESRSPSDPEFEI